jgi:hypothetical protein
MTRVVIEVADLADIVSLSVARQSFVSGGDGDDLLEGGLSRDSLRGDDGDDTLRGGVGEDELIGGPGADTLSGGTGFLIEEEIGRGGAGRDHGEFDVRLDVVTSAVLIGALPPKFGLMASPASRHRRSLFDSMSNHMAKRRN